MLCPKCVDKPLDQGMGPNGVIVDNCASCGGVWLDKGEIYHYVKDPQRLFKDFAAAYQKPTQGDRACPRCLQAMAQAQFLPPGPLIDACARCGGTWFDAGEIQAVQAMLDHELSAERASRPESPASAPSTEPQAAPSHAYARAAAAGLAALPSLAFRSAAVLLSLYAILAAFSAVVVFKLRLPVDYIFLSSSVSILLTFVVSPWLTDLSLRWFHAFRWVNPEELPEHLRRFINEACRNKSIPFPRVGIIEDGNPNAFTYGHYPGNARLVLTKGVMNLLGERELESVAGHEIGHIVHWDMLVMTAAALVPLVLYTIYKTCTRSRRGSSNDKGKGQLFLIGMIAFVLYYITEFIVLFLSRTRELYADRFSGEITQDPNSLSSALVKIAYGLAGHRPDPKEAESGTHETVRALGIFDPVGAVGLAASSLARAGAPSRENILGAMQWDLWSPWAKYYELQSTHPLPAHRLELLGRQAAAYGQEPFVNFDLAQPESYWDEFLEDLVMLWLPWLLAGASCVWDLRHGAPDGRMWAAAAAAWALGNLGRLWFSYRTGFYPEMNVTALLKKVKVSNVRGVPASLSGKIIGRGVPGYIISEDLVLQDQTGFIFLDYRQPLAIFQWIFALRRAPALIDRDVAVAGWYRRGPVPYLELRSLTCDGLTSTCWALEGKIFLTALVLAAGAAGLLGFF